eukprot:2536074-Rhodomonas_salina.3
MSSATKDMQERAGTRASWKPTRVRRVVVGAACRGAGHNGMRRTVLFFPVSAETCGATSRHSGSDGAKEMRRRERVVAAFLSAVAFAS